jgi:hypothetical protein
MHPLVTLQFPNFTAMKSMVEECSLMVASFNILNYTITGKFSPDIVDHALSTLGAAHYESSALH